MCLYIKLSRRFNVLSFLLFFCICVPIMIFAETNVRRGITKELRLSRWQPLSKQLIKANVVYVVREKHNLKGAIIDLPRGCTLKFQGGSIINGTLYGNGTIIEKGDENSFKHVSITGSWYPTIVCPEWFGAKGDGIEDDSKALQKAADFAAGTTLRLTKNRKYKYTEGVTIQSNTSIEGNGSTIVKACYGSFLHNINCNADVVDENISINGLNGITLNDSYRGLWLWMVGVKGLKISNCSFSNHTPLDADQHSQWGITVSGENIDINNCSIDNSGGGLFSDGIHVYNAVNCSIHDCVIITEDDCIGFAPEIPKSQISFDKYNRLSTNIRLYDNRLTGNRNCIRFEVRENAPKVFAYRNVNINDNILDGTTSSVGSFLYLHDYRKQNSFLNDSYFIRNVTVEGLLKGGGRNFIEVFGKNPEKLPKGVVNIKNVHISGIKANMKEFENYIRCIGVDNIVMQGCIFTAIDSAKSELRIRDCSNVRIADSDFTTYSPYPFMHINNSFGQICNNRIERLMPYNNAGIGIYLEDSNEMEVENNEITNFEIGIHDTRTKKVKDSNIYNRCNLNVQRQ